MGVSRYLNLPNFVYNNSSYFLYISANLDSEISKMEDSKRMEQMRQQSGASEINRIKSKMRRK
jgi:hypothetical protein